MQEVVIVLKLQVSTRWVRVEVEVSIASIGSLNLSRVHQGLSRAWIPKNETRPHHFLPALRLRENDEEVM